MCLQAAELETRLRRISVATIAVLLAGLGWVLWMGDRQGSLVVSHSPWVVAHHAAISAVSKFGMYPFYAFFLAALWIGWRRKNTVLTTLGKGYLIAQLGGAVIVVRVLKMLVGRERPGVGDYSAHWIGPTLESAFHSFPSGHTADLFVSAVFTTMLFPRAWVGAAALCFAVTVGLTRIALASHYPTDVLAGALIGYLASVATARWLVLPKLQRAG